MEDKLKQLKQGIIPIYEPGLEELIKANVSENRLTFTSDIKNAVAKSLVCFIAVGTPQGEDGSADLQYVKAVAKSIGQSIKQYTVIVDKSTVPVGTAFKVEKVINDIVDGKVNIKIASNPEFLKEGNAVNDCLRPDRVVIGAEDEEVFETLKELYASFVSNHDRFILMDVKSSEMTKYVANAMLATKISFMNEIANICEVTGADVKNVRLGIGSDKRIGYDFIYAGCGYGGSCFPKDVQALINTARDKGYEPKILSNVEEVNKNQKMVLVNKVVDRFGEDLSGLTFSIWGLSFKPYTDDVREATSLTVVRSLIDKGAKIRAYDSHAIDEFKRSIGDEYLDSIEFADNRYDVLDNADALILITEWKEFRNPDFDLISSKLNNNVIFDGRNIYNKNIREKGFELFQIGC